MTWIARRSYRPSCSGTFAEGTRKIRVLPRRPRITDCALRSAGPAQMRGVGDGPRASFKTSCHNKVHRENTCSKASKKKNIHSG